MDDGAEEEEGDTVALLLLLLEFINRPYTVTDRRIGTKYANTEPIVPKIHTRDPSTWNSVIIPEYCESIQYVCGSRKVRNAMKNTFHPPTVVQVLRKWLNLCTGHINLYIMGE